MFTTLRFGWLLIAFSGVSVMLPAQSAIQEDLARGDKQFDLYAYNLALRTYESVLKADPGNARALDRIADCYFQLNRPVESLPYYDRALSMAGAEPEMMLCYGKALMQTGDYVGAKKWFLFFAEGNPLVGRNYADMCDYAMAAAKKAPVFQVRNEPANTVAADYSPTFYGAKIVYSSARNDLDRNTAPKSSQDWTGSAYNQLYVSQRNGGTENYLQKPVFLQSDLENNYNEGPVSFSADGRRVAYCKNNFIDGTRQIADKGLNMSLYTADVVNGKWVNSKSFPYNGSDYATGFPCLSPDGNTLFFSSNQPNGFGGWDLYASYRTTDGWSSPRNLGTPLNTPGNEVTPFFDGTNLYFSSDWHKGLGGQDIFRTRFSDDVPEEIVHLGSGVNSPGDDYGFVYDEAANFGYFTSNRPQGRGNEDIWQVRKTTEEFSIRIVDVQKQPVPLAELDFSACGAGRLQTDIDGKYAFAVKAGQSDCDVIVRKPGYQSAEVAVRSDGEKDLTVTLLKQADAERTAAQPGPTNLFAKSARTPASDNMYTLLVTDHELTPLNYVEVDLNACGGGIFHTDTYGKCKFMLPDEYGCMITLNKNGYETVLQAIEANETRQIIVALTPNTKNLAFRSDREEELAPLTLSAQPEPASNPVFLAAKTVESTKPVASPEVKMDKVNKGYAVQLAAGPGALTAEKKAKFETLAAHGNLYTKTEGNINKVRLGVYKTRAEADAVLARAKAVAADAYLVNENGADAVLLVGNNQVSKSADLVTAPKNAPALPKPTETTYYAVRIGTYSVKDPVVIGKYSGLSDIGNVYTKTENGNSLVCVGVWANRAQAEIARQKLKDRGFEQAQTVPEPTGKMNLEGLRINNGKQKSAEPRTENFGAPPSGLSPKGVGTQPLPELAAPVTYNYKPPVSKPGVTAYDKKTANASTPGSYFVRVASMVNPAVFDIQKAESVGGAIEARMSEDSDMTVMLLGGFNNLEETMLATNRIRALGYKDAFIVKEVEGRLRKIQFMQ